MNINWTHPCEQLCVILRSLELKFIETAKLIEDEHEAIATGVIENVEQTAQYKVALAATIQEQVFILQDLTQQILTLAKIQTPVENLSELLNALKQTCLNNKQLQPLLSRLEACILSFLQTKQASYHPIQVNKLALSKVLGQRQENYYFWQQIAADIQASYNKQGQQKSREVARSFQAEA